MCDDKDGSSPPSDDPGAVVDAYDALNDGSLLRGSRPFPDLVGDLSREGLYLLREMSEVGEGCVRSETQWRSLSSSSLALTTADLLCSPGSYRGMGLFTSEEGSL